MSNTSAPRLAYLAAVASRLPSAPPPAGRAAMDEALARLTGRHFTSAYARALASRLPRKPTHTA